MSSSDSQTWTFLTSHTQVLLCLARDPEVRMKDVAETVGITERAAQRILKDLVDAGYVDRERVGRRNRYTINEVNAMRHAAQHQHVIGELLEVFRIDPASGRTR
jgi:DNA-binding MarR family transcriptional regulator